MPFHIVHRGPHAFIDPNLQVCAVRLPASPFNRKHGSWLGVSNVTCECSIVHFSSSFPWDREAALLHIL